MTDGSKSGAHDRSRRRRFRAGAGALALAAAFAFAGCARDDGPAAAPFGGTLAAPLPHRDVLGFLVVDPADSAWLARPELKLGGLDLAQTSVVAPLLAMVQLVRDHDVVPRGSRLALLFLDTDVHGGLAAYAWRGDAKSLRAAAAAAQIPFDAEGRLLLPGCGRARDLDLLTDALRRRDRNDAALPREVVMPDAASRRHELPRLPHWVVERDGVVLVLPAADGERNLFDTLAATRLLDVEAARLPCLRLAFGRLNDRYRATLSNYLGFAIDLLLPLDWSRFDESTWRARARARRLADGVLEAVCSVDELFLQRDGSGWQAHVRQRSRSFGEGLLDVVVNRPVAELLADVPRAAACVAGRFDPQAVQRVPDLLERSPFAFNRRTVGPHPQRFVASSDADDRRKEEESAEAFFAGATGRFWFAGSVDLSRATGRRERDATFDAESVGTTQLAAFFERKPDAEPVGLFTTLVDTLVPKGWRNPIRFGSALVYRPAPLGNGVVEIVAQEPDRVRRETLASIERGGVAPADGAPAEAFLVLRAERAWFGAFAGDLYATRAGSGITLRFVPVAQ